MSRTLRTFSNAGDSYFTPDKKWIIDLAAEGLADEHNLPSIVYAHIHKDLLSLQVRSGQKNELFVQSFPPTKELRPFQRQLKQDAEVVYTDDQTTFVYHKKKALLDVLKMDSKVGSLQGRLQGKKVCRGGDKDFFVLVIDNRLYQIAVNVMMELESTLLELPYTRIHDFIYIKNKLYVLGKYLSPDCDRLRFLHEEKRNLDTFRKGTIDEPYVCSCSSQNAIDKSF